MMKNFIVRYVLGAIVIACMLSAQASAQLRTIQFDATVADEFNNKTVGNALPTQTGGDFSNSGLNLGNGGYLFANFNAPSAVSGAPTTSNDRDTLPGWFSVNDYGDVGNVTSSGGQPNWANITLPGAGVTESGVSGAWLNDAVAAGTDAIFNEILLGANTPKSFLLHVVTDNTNNENDTNSRLRMRVRDVNDAVFGFKIDLNPIEPTNWDNGVDTYTFKLDNFRAGDVVRLQTNSGGVFPASLGGLMIDVLDATPIIPEPSSVMLMVFGTIGLGMVGYRRRK